MLHCLATIMSTISRWVAIKCSITYFIKFNEATIQLKELDVKWYHDEDPSPWLVHLPYHWSTPHVVSDTCLTPHVSHVFSNNSVTSVTLSHVTSAQSGVYTCKVSTNTQEIVSRARLNVVGKHEVRLASSCNVNVFVT